MFIWLPTEDKIIVNFVNLYLRYIEDMFLKFLILIKFYNNNYKAFSYLFSKLILINWHMPYF